MRRLLVRVLPLLAVIPLILGSVATGGVAGANASRSHVHHHKATPAKTRSHALAAHGDTPAPPCPSGYNCQTVPAVCPSGTTCPTVEVGPVNNLGPDQWVYVNLYDWSTTAGSGDYAHINYCSNSAPLPSAQFCVDSGGQGIAQTTFITQAFATGNSQVSFQTEEIDPTALPLEGSVPGDSGDSGSFFCNATASCAVDITDTGPSDQGTELMSPANTVVVPITFEPETSGCPLASTVNTQSDFGADLLFPVAARLSCLDANPSIAFNTAIDGQTAVSSLVSGAIDVAFTDNPEAADQQSVFAGGHFALIPIALSANVISFTAEERAASHRELFPDNQIALTPVMAAGLTTGLFGGGGADTVACAASGCVVPPCDVGTKKAPVTTCSLLSEVNYESGFLFAQLYSGFDRSDASASTGELLQWLCQAHTTPTSALGSTFSETQTAAQIVEQGLSPLSTPLTSCPQTEQLPPVRSGGTGYNAYSDPSQQALKVNAYVTPTVQQPQVLAGFAPMNWGDSQYYGMSVAALQNAAGDFVLPDQTSLDAALSDATVNPDGSLSPDETTTDPAAYPMPSITYAAVPTSGLTASQVTEDQEMLTQVLDLTGGPDTADLPAGFVPLPSSLDQQAQADIATDFTSGKTLGGAASNASGGGSSTTTTTSTTIITPTPAPSPNKSSGSTAGSSPAASPIVRPPVSTNPSPEPSTHVSLVPSLTTPITHPSGSGSTSSSGSRGFLESIKLTSSSSRLLLPLFLLLGMLALMLGILMFLLPGFRRRTFTLAHAGARGMRRSGAFVSPLTRRSTAAGPSFATDRRPRRSGQ